MKTRRIAAVLTLAALVSLGATIVYSVEGWVILSVVITFVGVTHILFIKDERVKPYTTIVDWVMGQFPEPDEMEEYGVKRRFNILQYKSKEGPWKIRFLFNRRHSDEEIKEAREELKDELKEDDTQK